MAKRSRKDTNGKNPRLPQAGQNQTREFTTSSGVVVVLHGMPPLEIPMIYESVEFPEKPTYEVTTASGDVERHTHDETTLSTDEEKAEWEAYLEATEEAEGEVSNRIMKSILIEAVEIRPTDMTIWEKRQKLKGVPVPQDEDAKLLMFKQTKVIGSTDDVAQIMKIVLALTGVDEEEIDQVLNTFQD